MSRILRVVVLSLLVAVSVVSVTSAARANTGAPMPTPGWLTQ